MFVDLRPMGLMVIYARRRRPRSGGRSDRGACVLHARMGSSMKRVRSRGPAAGAVVAALAATLALSSPAAASTLSGAVGGLRSNVQGTLPLDIRATAGDAPLANAAVVVDNVPFAVKIHDTETS